jgi:hypothetical protein
MTNYRNSIAPLLLLLAGLMLMITGCSQDEVTGPEADATFFAEDPLEDVLKSTDGMTPTNPHDRLARLAEVLELDEDQLAALTVAYNEFLDGADSLRDMVHNDEMTFQEANAALALLRETFEAEMQIILTADQWDLLQEMRFQGQRRDGHHPRHQPPHERWVAWLTEAGADEVQITEVFEALETFHTGIQDVRDQMHEGTLTREDARLAAETLRSDFHAALQTILTADQYDALMILRPDCGGPRHS